MASQDPLSEYYAALARLSSGKPKVLEPGTRITNNSVSLEAGRGKGSIKKSRISFSDLIRDIELAAKRQAMPQEEEANKPESRDRARADKFRRDWEAGLVREICLLKEIFELKQALAKLTGSNVIPIRKAKSGSSST